MLVSFGAIDCSKQKSVKLKTKERKLKKCELACGIKAKRRKTNGRKTRDKCAVKPCMFCRSWFSRINTVAPFISFSFLASIQRRHLAMSFGINKFVTLKSSFIAFLHFKIFVCSRNCCTCTAHVIIFSQFPVLASTLAVNSIRYDVLV
jgi:hypothetical protein